MKYVGTLYKGVIVAKGINYTGIVADDEIELTEEEYNTIPIPCKKIDGEFVPCDFPELDEFEEKEKNLGITQIATGSYTGGGGTTVTQPCPFHPDVIIVFTFGGKNINNVYVNEFMMLNQNGGLFYDTSGKASRLKQGFNYADGILTWGNDINGNNCNDAGLEYEWVAFGGEN